jgi:protein-tyrosine phosphatase
MYTRIYWIHDFNDSAKLGIMPRPRGGDWLADEITNFKKQNVGVLVSLLEKEEVDSLQLKDQPKLCAAANIEYVNFPIPDRGLPRIESEINGLVEELSNKIKNGLSVVVHCRMGIGRSSIIAAAVLVQAGLKADEIIEHISKIRGLKVPDTDEQMNWLRKRKIR